MQNGDRQGLPLLEFMLKCERTATSVAVFTLNHGFKEVAKTQTNMHTNKYKKAVIKIQCNLGTWQTWKCWVQGSMQNSFGLRAPQPKRIRAPVSKMIGLRAPQQKFRGSRDPPPLWDPDGGSKLWQGQVFLTLCPESSAPGICVIFLQSHNGNV